MVSLQDVVLVAVFTVVFLIIYKFVINPQTIITLDPSKMAKCPQRWNFNSSSQMCEPAYETTCLPFNPDFPNLKTLVAKRNLASTCATEWN